MRGEHLDELGEGSRALPRLARAIQASLDSSQLPDSPHQRGLLARQYLVRAVNAVGSAVTAKSEAARRSHTLLQEFYVRAHTRAETLERMGLAGGSFDREKSLALARVTDALFKILSESPGPEPLPGSAPGSGSLPSNWTTFQSAKGRYVPDRLYRVLWGRETEVNSIIDILNQPTGQPVVSVSGLGGTGKTALVREAAVRLLESLSFADVLWESAQRQTLVGAQIQTVQVEPLTFPKLIDTLILQVGLAHVANQDFETKKRALADLFHSLSFLIVLDNWDEFEDEVGSIRQMIELLGRSRLLITTRHRHLEELPVVSPIHLVGLSADETARYLREEATARRVDALAHARAEYLQQVHELTGGAPLALNLVIGQAQQWPIETVVAHLKQAATADAGFYVFLFWQDWQVLDFAARRTLIFLGRMIRTSVSFIQLHQAGLLEQGSYETMTKLLNLSLVETNTALDEKDRRYSLHPLVRHFVLSELPSQWNRQVS
jgi:hypothetical protein